MTEKEENRRENRAFLKNIFMLCGFIGIWVAQGFYIALIFATICFIIKVSSDDKDAREFREKKTHDKLKAMQGEIDSLKKP
ncbi:MAG: hypothetical protein AAB681_02405 [Patescibacteria group bacterium]